MRGRPDNTFKFVAMPSKAQPRREGSWWLRLDGESEADWRQRVKAKSLSFALSTADEMNQYAVKETA